MTQPQTTATLRELLEAKARELGADPDRGFIEQPGEGFSGKRRAYTVGSALPVRQTVNVRVEGAPESGAPSEAIASTEPATPTEAVTVPRQPFEEMREAPVPEKKAPRSTRPSGIDDAVKIAAVARFIKLGKTPGGMAHKGTLAAAAKEMGVSSAGFALWVKKFENKAKALNRKQAQPLVADRTELPLPRPPAPQKRAKNGASNGQPLFAPVVTINGLEEYIESIVKRLFESSIDDAVSEVIERRLTRGPK